jgi:hypothetical protein
MPKSIHLCKQKPDPSRETVPLTSERLLKCRRTDMFVDGGALAGPGCPQLALFTTRNSCNMLKVLSSEMGTLKLVSVESSL